MQESDIFGWLTIGQWMAVVRIVIGLWWIKSVFHKRIRHFLQEGMISWTVSLAENHPIQAYGRMMKSMLLATRNWFPYFQLFGEFAVGVGLTFGFLTPVSALAGIFMNLNFVSMAGVKPRNLEVNPCFRVEQGQNLAMIMAQLLVFVAGGWDIWSLDGWFGWFQL